jgi:hypothetical protein
VDIHLELDARRPLAAKTPIVVTAGLHPLLSPISALLAEPYHYYISRAVAVEKNTSEFT